MKRRYGRSQGRAYTQAVPPVGSAHADSRRFRSAAEPFGQLCAEAGACRRPSKPPSAGTEEHRHVITISMAASREGMGNALAGTPLRHST